MRGCKVHPSNISHTSLASPTTPIGVASLLHAYCYRTISCHFVATLLARTYFLQHFQIGTAHSGFSAPLPDILVATKRGSLGLVTRVSGPLCQLILVALGSIGGAVGCWGCVYIHLATHRAFPTIRFRRHSLTPSPLGVVQSLLYSCTFTFKACQSASPATKTSPTPSLRLLRRPSIAVQAIQSGFLHDTARIALGVSGP